MVDSFSGVFEGLDSPADNAVAVTPSDSVDLAVVPRGLYVGVSGSLVVHMRGTDGVSASVTFAAVPGGTLLPIRPTRVLSTGTTATAVVAVW